MSLAKKIISSLGGIAAAGLVSLVSGCAGLYGPETFSFPKQVECNPVTRVIPVDKVYYIPEII